MGIKEFVATFLNMLDKIVVDDSEVDTLTKIESYLAYNALIAFLKKFAESDAELNFRTLQQFCDFISARWVGIRHTHAAYPYARKTPANLAFQLFAEHIAQHLPLKPYDILMPSVAAILYSTSRKRLDDFKFQEFILGDDGTPIEIIKCLETAFENETLTLRHTSFPHAPLSAAECDRIIHHSEETENYYDALGYYLETGHVVDLFQADEYLKAAIQQETYQVKSSYGFKGKQKLAQYILSQIQSSDELVHLMEYFIPQAEWGDFLNAVDRADLERLLLQDDSLINSIQRRSLYNGNEAHDRATLYCLSEILRRDVQKMESNTGILGYLSWFNKEYIGKYRRFLSGFTNAEQQAATTLFQVFLRSNRPLYDFEAFLVAKHLTSEQRAVFKEIGSPLSFLVGQLKCVCDPKYFQEKSAGFFAIFGL